MVALRLTTPAAKRERRTVRQIVNQSERYLPALLVEGNSVRIIQTVEGLRPVFIEKFSQAYMISYGGAEEAAVMLFLAVRERAAARREDYPAEH